MIDWSDLYAARRVVAKAYGTIWQIPVMRRYDNVLERYGRKGVRLLELGAGDRGLYDKMQGRWGEFDYSSCDIDTQIEHDFADINSIEGKFEVVCGFELVEHLVLDEAINMVEKAFDVCEAGGVFVLTTPNIYYPPDFLRDATHRTPFAYDELGGLLSAAGFEVEAIYRLYHDSLFKKFIKRFLMYPVFRVTGIDFAHQICVVGRKAG